MKRIMALLMAILLFTCVSAPFSVSADEAAAEQTVIETAEFADEPTNDDASNNASDDNTDNNLDDAFDDISENISENISEDTSEDISEDTSDDASGDTSGDTSDDTSDDTSEDASGDISDNTSDDASEKVSEDSADDASAEPEFTDEYVTRAQAIYILVSGLGDDLKAVMQADLSVFADYDELEPMFYRSMGLAVSLGAINGSDDGMLHPNDYITRVEAFAVVSRVLSQSDLPTDLGDGSDFFTDVPDWAVNDISRLKNAGLVYGYGDGTLGSYDFMTYDQIKLIYDRLIAFQASLPTSSLYKADYYTYVNEQWLEETQLPAGYAKWSNAEQLSQNNAYRIQSIIGEIITDYYVGNEPAKGSNEQKILDIYLAAANEKYRESVGIEPIVSFLEEIDDINSISEFIYVLADLEKCGFHSLLPITVNTDFKDSTKYRVTFESCYTGIESGVIKSGDYEDIERAYRSYIQTLFIISGQSPTEASKNADDVTELCISLANAAMDESRWDDPAEIYNVYSGSKLKNLFSNINFDEYIQELGYSGVDEIIVYDEKLADYINTLITRDNINVLKQYLKAAVLDCSALYLNEEMFDAYQNYINDISGVSTKVSPSAYAVTITQSIMGLELGEAYVERYFSADSKKEVEDLAELIIKTFEKRIDNLDWMCDETKAVAKEKLESISIRIGYPEYLIGYTNKDFNIRSIESGGSLMEYLIDYNTMINEQNVNLINENVPVNKDNWSLTPQSVNAYYDRASNCIVIPAGILQSPYYSPNSSFETNLGGIGSVIAHEITHAFDNVGSQFDKNGNLNDWWTAEDYTAFNEICHAFISEYDKIEVMPGYYVDGKLTLSENIADIGSMACILDIAGKDNPNLDELFRTYARIYRTVCTDEYAKMLLATDEHSPNKVRVNMVLSNFEEFLNLYNLQPGCGMYRTEEERLSLW